MMQVMREDLATAADLGADGVVAGMLTREGDVDTETLSEFLYLCKTMVRMLSLAVMTHTMVTYFKILCSTSMQLLLQIAILPVVMTEQCGSHVGRVWTSHSIGLLTWQGTAGRVAPCSGIHFMPFSFLCL